ncbi:MAG: 50S ribosomal protein L11 [Pseudomonadota bacterium]
MSKEGSTLRLRAPAGQAKPAPPVGPMLGQHGLNIMDFCKKFNDMTKELKPGTPVSAIITFDPKQKKIHSIEVKKPPVSHFIKEAKKLKKGSGVTGKEIIATITQEEIKKIAEQKMVDMNAVDIAGAMKMVEGSAISMGLKVEQ